MPLVEQVVDDGPGRLDGVNPQIDGVFGFAPGLPGEAVGLASCLFQLVREPIRTLFSWQVGNAVFLHEAQAGDVVVVIFGGDQSRQDSGKRFGGGSILADGVTVLDKVLDGRRHAQAP